MSMDPKKRAAVEAAGHRVVTVQEFLGLSDAEAELVELRLRVVDAIRALRASAGLSQPQAAKLIGTSQPRLVKIEQGVGVSLDLLLRAYLALGGRLADLIAAGEPTAKPSRSATKPKSVSGRPATRRGIKRPAKTAAAR
jgi:transcriptional regulator with XRE-family HTH domain